MTSSLFKPDDGPLTLICSVRYYDWSHCFSLPLVSFAMSRRPKQFKYKTTDKQCARNVRRCASRLEWRDRIPPLWDWTRRKARQVKEWRGNASYTEQHPQTETIPRRSAQVWRISFCASARGAISPPSAEEYTKCLGLALSKKNSREVKLSLKQDPESHNLCDLIDFASV